MENDKPVKVFGYDIRKIPCFRDTFLYGLSTGAVTGLGTFLLTSRTQFAFNCGFFSYMLVGTVYWTQCRIRYVNSIFNTAQMQDMMEESLTMRGTEEFTKKLMNNTKDV